MFAGNESRPVATLLRLCRQGELGWPHLYSVLQQDYAGFPFPSVCSLKSYDDSSAYWESAVLVCIELIRDQDFARQVHRCPTWGGGYVDEFTEAYASCCCEDLSTDSE